MKSITCEICKAQESKYRCPKCAVYYCSLTCFNNTQLHLHQSTRPADSNLTTIGQSTNRTQNNNSLDTSVRVQAQKESEPSSANSGLSQRLAAFERISQDPRMQALLKYKSLHFHLHTLLTILTSADLTRETDYEGRKEIANMKLCNLRAGGCEENSLIEEFVSVVLDMIIC